MITKPIGNNYTRWADHDFTFDPRLKKHSVRSRTTERLFQLISSNMSLITEQISVILPMWLAMMHLEDFIRRPELKSWACLHENSFALVMKSDLRYPLKLAYNDQTNSIWDTPLQFFSMSEILVQNDISKIMNIYIYLNRRLFVV